jgi:tetratricopeptide (TPR) repeat protein
MPANPLKVSILIAWIMLLSPFSAGADAVSHVTANSHNAEESEITSAEAQIAETDAHYDQALKLSQKAVALNPFNSEAIDVWIEAAKKLHRDDLVKTAEKLKVAAKKKEKDIDTASKQLLYAESDMKSEKWKISSQRLEYITRTLRTNDDQDPGRDLFNEAQYRLGLAYLAQSDFARAMDELLTTSTIYRQQALAVLGNYCFQNSYLMDALKLYTAAATQPANQSEINLTKASLQAIRNLSSFAYDVRGGVSVTYDSNPFGYPEGIESSDGTPNNNLATSVSLTGLLRSPIHKDYPWYYALFLSLGQYRSIEQGSRAQFDSESVSTGVTLAGSRFPIGRVALRYGFQYSQSPILENESGSSIYNYAAASRVHTLNFDLSKDFAPSISIALNSHVVSSHFVTPDDSGDGNRTGNAWGGYFYGSFRSESHLFFPSLKLGFDRNYAQGDEYYSRTYYGRAANFIQFGKSGAEIELSFEYDWSIYSEFTEGRSDFVLKPGSALIFPLSGHVSSLAQITYSSARSTASYYNQNRFVGSAGLAFTL